jgi:hypothetical protein
MQTEEMSAFGSISQNKYRAYVEYSSVKGQKR